MLASSLSARRTLSVHWFPTRPRRRTIFWSGGLRTIVILPLLSSRAGDYPDRPPVTRGAPVHSAPAPSITTDGLRPHHSLPFSFGSCRNFPSPSRPSVYLRAFAVPCREAPLSARSRRAIHA